jgi:zinc protease
VPYCELRRGKRVDHELAENGNDGNSGYKNSARQTNLLAVFDPSAAVTVLSSMVARSTPSVVQGLKMASDVSPRAQGTGKEACLWLSVFVCILFVGSTASARLKIPYTPIKVAYLHNGLRVVMAQNGQAPLVNLQVWYEVGSKDEHPGMRGFAHLFEHLMFDGDTNLAPGEFSNYIVRSGGVDNAYTTTDATVFWETVPSNNLSVALWLEADRMRNLRITEATFDKEKDVVEEERRHRFDNEPYGDVLPALYAHAFKVSPYRYMPIGSTADLARATLADVQSFYNTYYEPGNATLVIVGNFDEGQAENWVQQYFGPIHETLDPISRNYPQEPAQTARRVVKLTSDVALAAFVEGYHIPADGTPDSYALQLVAKILSDGDSSWLYRDLVYQKQMAMQVDCDADLAEEPNLFLVSVIMNPGYTLAQGEAEEDAILNQLQDAEISPLDLTRAKNEVLRDFLLKRQTAQSSAEALGYDTVILKNPDLYNTGIDRLLQVTPDQIAEVARKYLQPANSTVVEVYPKHK